MEDMKRQNESVMMEIREMKAVFKEEAERRDKQMETINGEKDIRGPLKYMLDAILAGSVKLLGFKTHVVGTVCHNRKFMPKAVTLHLLKRGEIISRKDDNGIVVLKWRDARDVRILSSKYAPLMVPVSDSSILRGRPPKIKPLAVIAYDTGKSGSKRSDQMASYATTIRKSFLHKMVSKTSNSFPKREWLESENAWPQAIKKATHHLQIRKNLQGKSIRRMCVRCYAKQRQTLERQDARKNVQKTITYCPECPQSPQICLKCFNEYHYN
ncbi:PREDICTED: uncharacterized protein LOC108550015 [Eufriesea mexicana]|uniref:uncharacterized protein LOC108550015 n=1 Tax=Eufriesea mexicana TaxID=516756 RepID=UPI00083BD9DC|nr:PREDICTED: uncharacterized protein LOC108550015 [Eufriesea mexicana]